MSGFYHQDERDGAAAGCVVLVVAIVVTTVLSVVACRMVGEYNADVMDGSNAGANAVTAEQLQATGGVAYVKREGEPPYIDRALYEVPEGIESYVVLDRWNNVEYVLVKCGESIAITPRLGEAGDTIVMLRE